MAELTLTINNRSFNLTCDDGQEQRVNELSQFVDSRLKQVASAGAAGNESHLYVLTSLMLADEIFDLRERLNQAAAGNPAPEDVANAKQDEIAIAEAIEKLAMRIDGIASRINDGVKKAS